MLGSGSVGDKKVPLKLLEKFQIIKVHVAG